MSSPTYTPPRAAAGIEPPVLGMPHARHPHHLGELLRALRNFGGAALQVTLLGAADHDFDTRAGIRRGHRLAQPSSTSSASRMR